MAVTGWISQAVARQFRAPPGCVFSAWASLDGLLERRRRPIDALGVQRGTPTGRHLDDDPPGGGGVTRAQRELDVAVAVDRIPQLAVGGLTPAARNHAEHVGGDLRRLGLVEPSRVVGAGREHRDQRGGAVDVGVPGIRTAVLETVQRADVVGLRVA